ncbi:MAG: hypothetical protein ACK52A_08645, partial [Planctomycetota bacterium]
ISYNPAPAFGSRARRFLHDSVAGDQDGRARPGIGERELDCGSPASRISCTMGDSFLLPICG